MTTELDAAKLQPRTPIVAIMGHVGHGKTFLLRSIFQTSDIDPYVVPADASGISQFILTWFRSNNHRIIFLDVPGHATAAADIAVVVVAATDGVKPQTLEAIRYAREADMDIIVAINKIDMPNADVERTRWQLYAGGLLPGIDMGGEVPFVETSATTFEGVSTLLDTIIRRVSINTNCGEM